MQWSEPPLEEEEFERDLQRLRGDLVSPVEDGGQQPHAVESGRERILSKAWEEEGFPFSRHGRALILPVFCFLCLCPLNLTFSPSASVLENQPFPHGC